MVCRGSSNPTTHLLRRWKGTACFLRSSEPVKPALVICAGKNWKDREKSAVQGRMSSKGICTMYGIFTPKTPRNCFHTKYGSSVAFLVKRSKTARIARYRPHKGGQNSQNKGIFTLNDILTPILPAGKTPKTTPNCFHINSGSFGAFLVEKSKIAQIARYRPHKVAKMAKIRGFSHLIIFWHPS